MAAYLSKPPWPVLQRGNSLAQGLVGAWPFYEGAGATAHDLSGSQYDGAFSGSVTWVGSPFGSALNFSSAGIDLSTLLYAVGAGDFSASAWINPANTSTEVFFATTAGGTDFWFGKSTAALLSINGAGPLTGGTIATNTWQHIAAVRQGGTCFLYLNGAQVVSGIMSGTVTDTGYAIGKFGNPSAGFNFTGAIADVLFYKRALSAGEVGALYSDPFAIYRKPSRWWELPTSAPATYTPYNPWPLSMPLLAQ